MGGLKRLQSAKTITIIVFFFFGVCVLCVNGIGWVQLKGGDVYVKCEQVFFFWF